MQVKYLVLCLSGFINSGIYTLNKHHFCKKKKNKNLLFHSILKIGNKYSFTLGL